MCSLKQLKNSHHRPFFFYSSCSCLSFRIIFNIHKFSPPLKIGCIFTSFHFNPFRHIVPFTRVSGKISFGFFFIDYFMYRVEMIIIDDLCSRIYSSSMVEMGEMYNIEWFVIIREAKLLGVKARKWKFLLEYFYISWVSFETLN